MSQLWEPKNPETPGSCGGKRRFFRPGNPFRASGSQSVHLSERLLGKPGVCHRSLTMKVQSDVTRDDLQKRLRRIEGQVRGIQRMLDEDRDCQEIVQQMSAAQAALRTATDGFLHAHARECLVRSVELDTVEQTAVLDELFGLLARTK